MCYYCYQGMNKDKLLFQLKSILDQENYSKWNQTSVNFMELIIRDPSSSEELRNVATSLLEGYRTWITA